MFFSSFQFCSERLPMFFCGGWSPASSINSSSLAAKEIQIFGNALPTSWGSGARLVGGAAPWLLEEDGLEGGQPKTRGWRFGFFKILEVLFFLTDDTDVMIT